MTHEFENEENDSNETSFANELAMAAAIAAVTVVASLVAKAVCLKIVLGAQNRMAKKEAKNTETD